jgi:hypothetical protein
LAAALPKSKPSGAVAVPPLLLSAVCNLPSLNCRLVGYGTGLLFFALLCIILFQYIMAAVFVQRTAQSKNCGFAAGMVQWNDCNKTFGFIFYRNTKHNALSPL